MKVSKDYFEQFKEAFTDWQERLGLTQYRIDFFQTKLSKSYAEISVNEADKAARVDLTKKLGHDSAKADRGPESHARHEALHLLTHRLLWLGESRYIERSDLGEEWEVIVVRLEKVFEDYELSIKELTRIIEERR